MGVPAAANWGVRRRAEQRSRTRRKYKQRKAQGRGYRPELYSQWPVTAQAGPGEIYVRDTAFDTMAKPSGFFENDHFR